jgi:L-asparagine transporter-like permease
LTSSSIDAKKINSNTEIITAIEIIANFLLSTFRVIIHWIIKKKKTHENLCKISYTSILMNWKCLCVTIMQVMRSASQNFENFHLIFLWFCLYQRVFVIYLMILCSLSINASAENRPALTLEVPETHPYPNCRHKPKRCQKYDSA